MRKMLAVAFAMGAAAGIVRAGYVRGKEYHSAAWQIFREAGLVGCKEWCACQCGEMGCGCHEGPPPRNDPRRSHGTPLPTTKRTAP